MTLAAEKWPPKLAFQLLDRSRERELRERLPAGDLEVCSAHRQLARRTGDWPVMLS
jgi:hypothetical protein